MLIGAPGHDSGAGTAYIFTDGVGGWSETAELNASGTEGLGYTVALGGTTAVAGAGEGQGAYVFTDGEDGWEETTNLSCGEVCYVVALAIEGSTLVVGGFNASSVFIYTDESGIWTQTGYLADPSENTPYFGASVALSGSNIIVGAPNSPHSKKGRAFIYTGEGDSWTQIAALSAVGPSPDLFGQTVAFDGSLAFVASPGTVGVIHGYTIS